MQIDIINRATGISKVESVNHRKKMSAEINISSKKMVGMYNPGISKTHYDIQYTLLPIHIIGIIFSLSKFSATTTYCSYQERIIHVKIK